MPGKTDTFLQKYSSLLIAGLIVLTCVVIYGQVYNFDFINIDDRAYIYENPQVLSGLNWRSISWALTATYAANWHPLTWISHMADVSIFGMNAGGHHVTNVVFHTINSVLAFLVFRKFTGEAWKGAAVALLFVVHPAHVESVAWVAERKDVLSTMFWLLAMLVYFAYARTKSGEQAGTGPLSSARTLYVLLIVVFALGLMSKPMLVTLPFVLLLCDYWSLERLRTTKDILPLLLEKAPLFALTIVSSVITFTAQQAGGATASLETFSLGERLANIAASYGRYLAMLVYPADLGIWYPFNRSLDAATVAGSAVSIAAVSAICWHQRSRRKFLLMGWLWFLGTLVPVIGLVQVGGQSHADRYTYIPYFGLFIMAVWGAADIAAYLKLDKKVLAAAFAVVTLALGVVCFRQVSLWRNSGTLYTHTLSFTDGNFMLLSNLCLYKIASSTPDVAEKQCSELLGKMPPSPENYNILGLLKTDVGKFDEAVKMFDGAIRLMPSWGLPYANKSSALARQGDLAEAEIQFQKGLSLNKSDDNQMMARACNILANGFAKKGRLDKAELYLLKSLELAPDNADVKKSLEKLRSMRQ